MSTVLIWDGVDFPEELRRLPKGRSMLVPVDQVPELTPDQEAGIEAALESVRAGHQVTRSDARERVTAALRR